MFSAKRAALRGEVFSGWFAMRDTCEVCGLKYEREPGYFVGAIYLNFAVTAVVCLGGALLVAMALGLPPWGEVGSRPAAGKRAGDHAR